MRIRMEESGGLAYMPGLDRSVEIDTDDLHGDEAAYVESLASSTTGYDEQAAGRPAVPDARQYHVTISEGVAVRAVVVHDPLPPGPVGELVVWLRSRLSGTEGTQP